MYQEAKIDQGNKPTGASPTETNLPIQINLPTISATTTLVQQSQLRPGTNIHVTVTVSTVQEDDQGSNEQEASNPVQSAMTSQHQEQVCICCGKTGHQLCDCPHFLLVSRHDRATLLRGKAWCFSCLNGRHPSKECQTPSTCKICSKPHHTLLHRGMKNEWKTKTEKFQ